MKEKQNIYLSIHNFICFIVLGINFLTMTNVWMRDLMESYIAYINTIYLLISFFVLNRYMKRIQLFGWMVFVGSTLGIALLNGSSMGAVCSFIDVLITIVYFQKLKFGASFLKVWFWINVIVLLWALVKSPFAYSHFIDGKNVINPNVVAFCIYICFCTCVILMKNLYRVSMGWLFLMWLICMAGEWLIKSRTSLAVIILFGVSFFFFKKFFIRKRKLFVYIICAILVVGCLFPFIYMKLGNNDVIQAFIYQYTGKTFFSGREWIWRNLFNEMGKSIGNLLLGPGSNMEYQIGLGFSMHNLYMQIMLDFGVVGVVFFVIFVIFQIAKELKNDVNAIQMDLLLAYVGLLVMSYAEVVIFTSYSCILCGMFLGMVGNPFIKELGNANGGT